MPRLHALDALRGLAVVLMVLHHALDAWVHPSLRSGETWRWLRFLGGIPAPTFLFLAGVSAALVLVREREKGAPPLERSRSGVRRGLYVLGIAFAFRLGTFLLGGSPWSRWEQLFRVDVLNCMGVALALTAGLAGLARSSRGSMLTGLAVGAGFLLPTPLVHGAEIGWPTTLLGRYVAGTGPLTLFPLLPWAAWVGLGHAMGELLAVLVRERARFAPSLRLLALAGALLFVGATWLIKNGPDVYPPHDVWRASPFVVLRRLGRILVMVWAACELYARLPKRWFGSDPLLLLGRHSLLAYLLHLELTYGRPAWGLRQRLDLGTAFAGIGMLLVVCWAAARVAENGLSWPGRQRAPLPETLAR